MKRERRNPLDSTEPFVERGFDPLQEQRKESAGERETVLMPKIRITGKSLSKLTELRDLEELSLSGTERGDDEIAVLAQLPALKVLNLSSTKVTEAAIEKLGEQRPGLQVQ